VARGSPDRRAWLGGRGSPDRPAFVPTAASRRGHARGGWAATASHSAIPANAPALTPPSARRVTATTLREPRSSPDPGRSAVANCAFTVAIGRARRSGDLKSDRDASGTAQTVAKLSGGIASRKHRRRTPRRGPVPGNESTFMSTIYSEHAPDLVGAVFRHAPSRFITAMHENARFEAHRAPDSDPIAS
jgi:hypothetical protein